ncbi:MAG: desulfoferrodoxin [Thermotogae bacterium]|nr:desulfoferrodoxin [Thermotogota bacterium]
MTEKMQVYKCEVCGNIVEVLHEGAGELVCCGKPMKLMEEKTADTSQEKHVPFIKRENDAYVVVVGENALHPMEEKHYIEWIELIVDDVAHKKFLKPGDKPEAVFEVPEGQKVFGREYCNVHGLWTNKEVK